VYVCPDRAGLENLGTKNLIRPISRVFVFKNSSDSGSDSIAYLRKGELYTAIHEDLWGRITEVRVLSGIE
jgi:hypothetical protein